MSKPFKCQLPEGYIWLEEFPDYAINKQGQVLSFKKYKDGYPLKNKAAWNKGWYIVYSLREGNQTHERLAHRLVMQTFKPVENMENLEVNHKDGDKSNCDINNLEWCTHQENMQHAYEYGLLQNDWKQYNTKGENSPTAKFTKEEVLWIRHLRNQVGLTTIKLAELFDTSPSHISGIATYKCWRHV